MSSGSHLSKELFDLVKAIGESRSKQEEDKIIVKEVSVLKNKINEKNIQPKKMKEYLIRATYIELLGHDASFAYIHAVNLTQERKILCKRVGYMSCNLFLNQESPLMILLVSTIQKDLQSKSYLEVIAALITCCKLMNQTIVHPVLEPVTKLLTHNEDIVRKKAVMVMHKIYTMSPELCDDHMDKIKRTLCDGHPSVMGASLNIFHELSKRNPYKLKELTGSFVCILKQIIEHRLPRDYDYHRMPAPWIQIKLLQILSVLGSDDQKTSEGMYEILGDVMRRADDTGINVGYAIVYQCLKTITKIYPSKTLIETVSNSISRFIASENNNLKFIGVTGLVSIVQINSKYVAKHQGNILECLESGDDTLKRKTLDLLYRMTNANNVKPIVEKLLHYLKQAGIDSHFKNDLVGKVSQLAERYAPSNEWYIETMNTLFVTAGEYVTHDMSNNLMKLLAELGADANFRNFTIETYMKLIKKAKLSDNFLQIMIWSLGEFGQREGSNARADDIVNKLTEIMENEYENNSTKGWILGSLLKVCVATSRFEDPAINSIIAKYSNSKSVDLQQRAYEFMELKNLGNPDLKISSEGAAYVDPELGFLDEYVGEAVQAGHQQYDPSRFNRKIKEDGTAEINYQSYQRPDQSRFNYAVKEESKPIYSGTTTSHGGGDSKIKVSGPSVWGPEGYNGPKQTAGTSHPTTTAGSHNPGAGGKVSLSSRDFPTDSTYSRPTQNRQKVEKPKIKSENELFMESVLGLGGEEDTSAQESSNTLEEETTATVESSTHSATTTTTTTSSHVGGAASGGDLLDFDISGGNTENKAQESGNDLLGVDFGGSAGGSNDHGAASSTSVGGGGGSGLFDMNFSSSTPSVVTPLTISTAQFGGMWPQIGPMKNFEMTSSVIFNPQKYMELVQTRLNFHPVDIRQSEAIAAAKTQGGETVLLHCSVGGNGNLTISIKSNDQVAMATLMTLCLEKLAN
eukprot:CAMPEP_0114990534 /NCGR_PEP_ID=MMETSP0216-20121206/10855_1 /TAXON_ID=223996 /ORGANISM="Protocruzia adherens, Strain Boccale" /LENGTH=968 /DNA_ID=CAMNT_0002353731 /DNA_START=40 /DNA_END=2946 /DNA_ORIENTATION=-